MLFPIAFFAFGAIVASFVGVIVARLNTGQSFFAGRSRCDACGATLSPAALVPIVFHVASRGRARCCSARVSELSLLSELLLGALFAGAYLTLGFVPALPFFLLALAALLALVLYDLAHQILPTAFLAFFIVASALARFLLSSSAELFFGTFGIAVLIAFSLAFVHVVSRGRMMGLADAPLAFGLALLTGPAAFPGFIFSFWIGAVIGIFLLLKRPGSTRMDSEVPFAPFLAAGFLLAYFTQWNPFIFILGFAALLPSK